MPLPKSVRVRLLSDEAGSVSFTSVITQEMTTQELLDRVVAHVGKDAARVVRVLRAGTLVKGSSRFQWEGWNVREEDLAPALERYPDPDPVRPFTPQLCTVVVLYFRQGGPVEIDRQALARRRFLRRRSFWDAILAALSPGSMRYQEYSYREQADRYRAVLDLETADVLRGAAGLLPYGALVRRLQATGLTAIDLFVRRG